MRERLRCPEGRRQRVGDSVATREISQQPRCFYHSIEKIIRTALAKKLGEV